MANLFDLLKQQIKAGVQRVKERPLTEYFLPTSNKARESVNLLGELFQKFPSTEVKIQTPQPSPAGVGNFSPVNATGFITKIPGDIIQSYGRTMSKLGTKQKLGFEDYLNISDFIPGLGFIGAGVKPVEKELAEEVVEKVGKEATKEGTVSRLKHLLTYNDTVKRMYNLNDAEIAKIDFKKAQEILDALPTELKKQVEAIPRLSKFQTEAPLPVKEFEYELAKRSIDIKKKANILDYLRTPENVLNRIGLTNESKAIRSAYEGYQTQLKEELTMIKSWVDRVPEKKSAVNIFDYLNGDLKFHQLSKEELQVGNEIKTHLARWADRLGLPEEKRVTDYITHLFERTQDGIEFPLDISKKIQDKVAGSVYDPFLEQRTGKPEYVRDVWRALEAYTKRATRKVNFDPALSMLKDAAEKLDPYTEKYLMRYSHGINLRPTEIDEGLDNLIKQSPIGYKFTSRPTAYFTQKWRQMIYRGALGLNFGSALRNLTQGVNTFSELGIKYTALGYTDMAKHLAQNDLEELIKHNVLSDNIIEDRTYHAVKNGVQKLDENLFNVFDLTEKINRASAYFGAKKKALNEGKLAPEAIEYAKNIVRKTQFSYAQIDVPVALQSDLVKTFMQFGTYPVKQVEFLMGKVGKKEFSGLLRYLGGSLVAAATIGKLFGMKLKDFIPFSDARFESPAGGLVSGLTSQLSSSEQKRAEGKKKLQSLASLLIPAGAQVKKSVQGAVNAGRGYTQTAAGNFKYSVPQDATSYLRRILFGEYSTPESRDYYNKK